MRQKN